MIRRKNRKIETAGCMNYYFELSDMPAHRLVLLLRYWFIISGAPT